MTLIELKNYIVNKTVPSDFMIFIAKDNTFLAKQYADAIVKLNGGNLNKISSIYEPKVSSVSLLTSTETAVNILKVDTFAERAEDYTIFENTIVICDQVDKTIIKTVEPYIIQMPKLEEWQICDYVKTLCPSIEDSEITWLVQASNNNIDRIINEISKVALFKKEDQAQILNEIRFDPQSDLYKVDLFTIVNAIVDGNLPILFDFLKHKNFDLFEPIVLANRALTSLKNIILVIQNPLMSATELGVSPAQQRMLKYKYNNLDIQAAKEKLKFLVNIDLMLKSSKLELSKQNMLNYIIVNTAYKITK